MIIVRYINTINPPLSACQCELGEGAGPAAGKRKKRGELGLHDRKKEVGRGDIRIHTYIKHSKDTSSTEV